MPGHEFSCNRVGMEGRSSFPPSRCETERESSGPVLIVVLGCEKTRATPDMCLFGSSVRYHASHVIIEHRE